MLARRFAARSSAKQLARAAPAAFSSSTTADTARLNLALVGTGRMGRIRLADMLNHPRVRIAAIIDSALAADQRRELEAQFNTTVFDTVEEAAASSSSKIDGVWIATPTPTHLKLVNDCLQHAGASLKTIGIEKPVGGSLEEIDAAYDGCRKRDVHLFCSFQRRFDPSYQALRSAVIDQQKLGKLQSIHTVFRDHPCPPIEFLKTGGDPFHDLAVHDIDYVCDLVGEYPTKVYAFGTSLSPELREVGVMDKASVWLEFPNTGVVCTMDLSRSAAYGYDQRVEVSGERGMLQVENPRRTSLVTATDAGISTDVLSHSFPERFRDAYARELDSFVNVTSGAEKTPRVHWNASRMATVVAEAARIAAVEKKPVNIKFGGETKQTDAKADPLLVCEYEY